MEYLVLIAFVIVVIGRLSKSDFFKELMDHLKEDFFPEDESSRSQRDRIRTKRINQLKTAGGKRKIKRVKKTPPKPEKKVNHEDIKAVPEKKKETPKSTSREKDILTAIVCYELLRKPKSKN